MNDQNQAAPDRVYRPGGVTAMRDGSMYFHDKHGSLRKLTAEQCVSVKLEMARLANQPEPAPPPIPVLSPLPALPGEFAASGIMQDPGLAEPTPEVTP